MNKYVMKKTVIKALQEEPLTTGHFTSDRYDPNCPVCAVGAVLRRSGFNGYQINKFGNSLGDSGPITDFSMGYDTIESLLEEKKYLHALSVRFEEQATKTGTGKRTRDIMVKFVETSFPNRIRLSSK